MRTNTDKNRKLSPFSAQIISHFLSKSAVCIRKSSFPVFSVSPWADKHKNSDNGGLQRCFVNIYSWETLLLFGNHNGKAFIINKNYVCPFILFPWFSHSSSKCIWDGEKSDLTRKKEENVSRQGKKKSLLRNMKCIKITTFVEHCKSCKMLLHDFSFPNVESLTRKSRLRFQNWYFSAADDAILVKESIKNLESILTLGRSLNFRLPDDSERRAVHKKRDKVFRFGNGVKHFR